jgi:hypothetical protein
MIQSKDIKDLVNFKKFFKMKIEIFDLTHVKRVLF